MDMYEMIREQMSRALPFARLTGVDLVDLAPGRGVARLGERADVLNHIGTVHAGAIFTLGETASGAAMTATFADVILSIRPVAAEARISYMTLARGMLTATATCTRPADALRAELDAEGRTVFDVEVDIVDEQGRSVAAMVVAWNVRKA